MDFIVDQFRRMEVTDPTVFNPNFRNVKVRYRMFLNGSFLRLRFVQVNVIPLKDRVSKEGLTKVFAIVERREAISIVEGVIDLRVDYGSVYTTFLRQLNGAFFVRVFQVTSYRFMGDDLYFRRERLQNARPRREEDNVSLQFKDPVLNLHAGKVMIYEEGECRVTVQDDHGVDGRTEVFVSLRMDPSNDSRATFSMILRH